MITKKRFELGRTPEGPHKDDLWGGSVQLKEGAAAKGTGESDSPIVVGDGRADHMAKGWAGEQSQQRTDVANDCRGQTSQAPCMAWGAGEKALRKATLSLRSKGNIAGVDARSSEEPGAGKLHAGICEGAV